MHRNLDRSQTLYGNSRDEKNLLPLPAIKPRYVQRDLESLGNGLGKLYSTDCEGLDI